MWSEVLREATGTGRLRRMLAECPTGKILNWIRDNDSNYIEALERISEEHSCAEYRSCIQCKDGQAAVIRAMGAQGLTVIDGEREVFDHYVASGFSRSFPELCGSGQKLATLFQGLAQAELDPTTAQGILRESDSAGCLKRRSCANCDQGIELLEGDLLLLASEGYQAVRERWSEK